jgi:DNA topoisomerase-3
MSSVAKYVEDEQVKAALLAKDKDIKGESGSIGTSATRADIIDGLVRGGWLEASAKGRLTSSEKGRALYDALPEAIKLADTTGLWWLMQEQVAQGKLDPYAIEDSVVAVFKAHQGWTYGGLRLDGRKTVGACPRCKAKLVDGGKVITCSSNKNERQPDGTWKQVSGCGFRLWRTQYGHKLTDKEVTQLVEGGKTTAKLTFKSKAGKPYKAYLALNDQTGEVNLVFDDQGKQPSR